MLMAGWHIEHVLLINSSHALWLLQFQFAAVTADPSD